MSATRASPWFRRAVVYQIYPRSFADANGDGVGDLRGVIERLDYLALLGVDVVWLSPIYRSPQDDNGYDISDYRDVDPMFGTLADFDELVARAHAHGIKVVMDLVVNHTSDEHSWFVESRSSRDNPKRDWYWWRAERPGFTAGAPGAEPTNWASFFSGPVWEYDESGEYYLHLFSRKQPDLNWENQEVRSAVYEMMRWWLDRGVDGFRMDVINMISKAVGDGGVLPDGAVRPGERYGDGWPHFICGPRIHEFIAEMHREVFSGRDGELLTVGEMPGVTVDEARLFTDPQRAELDMVFQFEHMNIDQASRGLAPPDPINAELPGGRTVVGPRADPLGSHASSKWNVRPFSVRRLKESLGRWQAGLAASGWNSLYWNNHDQPRVVSRFGDDSAQYRVASAKALATVLHLHRGTPYIYQGEELGMTNAPVGSIDDVDDIEARNFYADAVAGGVSPDAALDAIRARGRDNARTPMQWDAGPYGGFTSGTPWLAVNPNYTTINAAAAVADGDSIFHHYRRLIALRHDEPAVADGDFTMLLTDDDQIYAFTRRLGDIEMLVVANLSSSTATFDGAPAQGGELLLHSGSPTTVTTDTELAPWEARVYRRAAVDVSVTV